MTQQAAAKITMTAKERKYGAFGGVFTPSILSILGVIMFLRLPWIVGQVGLWTTLGIILVAHVISISTGLSIASVATDKRVGRGGIYYIISRSLGLPIGGTLGMAFFIGMSFAASMYLIGFSETILSYFGYEIHPDNIRLVGSGVLLLVAVVSFISTTLAIRLQYLIMAVMGLALLSIFTGSHAFMPAAPQWAALPESLPWITLFAIFFPAVTGFAAGVSMSGTLTNPRKQIPRGTLGAILVSFAIYVGLAVFFALTIDRELLVNDPRVLFVTSRLPQVVMAGILGATLSSALASIMTAPRILQAVALDRILPAFLSRGHGLANEPRYALLLAYLIAQSGIMIGDLNVIARLVTIFFILTYGFLNITYFLESWASSDFRPSFKIPRVVSVVGALACVILMIQLDLIALIVASLLLAGLFLFLKNKEVSLQAGDTWGSIWASLVKTGLWRLRKSSGKLRNWRPNVLVFSGGEQSRPHLVEMGKALVGKLGIFTSFELVENATGPDNLKKIIFPPAARPLPGGEVFTRRHECRDLYEGIDLISRVYGYSGFEPNTILMGWPSGTRKHTPLADLLEGFRQQDFNTCFLRYERQKGFGTHQSIDFWWTGKGRNLSLAIALLRFITTGNTWRGAHIRILAINYDSSQTETLYKLGRQALENHRLPGTVQVINNGVEQLPEADIIHAESRHADLCMLELPSFDRETAPATMEEIQGLTAGLGSCLLIRASSLFEEIGLLQAADLPAVDAPLPGQPQPMLKKHLHASGNEMITQAVFHAGQVAEECIGRYYQKAYQAFMDGRKEFFAEMGLFAGKTLGNLEEVLTGMPVADRARLLLRILNDFSFHSQRQMRLLKDRLIPTETALLQEAASELAQGLSEHLMSVPEKIRISRNREAFRLDKNDGWRVSLYKLRKRLAAWLARRPVRQKIHLLHPLRYYVRHRRLEALHRQMNDYALLCFSQVTEIRKLLSAIYETVEKARLSAPGDDRPAELARMEKSRLMARIGMLADEHARFCQEAGQALYEDLLHDLRSLMAHLEDPASQLTSGNFKAYKKQEMRLEEQTEALPLQLNDSLQFFVNKGAFDFLLLSLRSRIHSKIGKQLPEFRLLVGKHLLDPLSQHRAFALECQKENRPDTLADLKKISSQALQPPALQEVFGPLIEEIRQLLREVPEKMEISGDQFAENMGQDQFRAAAPVVVNVRKTVSFFVGSGLIDHVNQVLQTAGMRIQEVINGVRDQIRLLNFNLHMDEDPEEGVSLHPGREQQQLLLAGFARRMEADIRRLETILQEVEQAFETGLKKAFDPLSSATITRTSADVQKRMRGSDGKRLAADLSARWKAVAESGRNQLVKLLYSRSEGMLWLSKLEQQGQDRLAVAKRTLALAEAITPSPALLNNLPFYCRSLFSGQSGTGDDFWVGMEKELAACGKAVERFKAGVGGALLITGLRSSGKSSLARKVARMYFAENNIHSLRAPRGCTADVAQFTQDMLEALDASNANLDDVFRAMPRGKAIIIQDLGLWWERRPGGDAVVDRIRRLIDRYGHKCLFIIHVNTFALGLIDRWCCISRHALDTVNCEPFDARELKEMILLRHQAGGMRLMLNKKAEEKITALEYARFFNRLFNNSYGNPGTALGLWNASIKKVSGNTLYVETLRLPSVDAFDALATEQWFLILQFATHRRYAAKRLAEVLGRQADDLLSDIRELERAGILVERFEGVYAIRPGLDLFLTGKIQKMRQP